jgi:hypothetical protein
MDKEQKYELIRKLEDASSAFDDVLQLSEDIINFRPALDAWSIKEQIVHCLDVDAANFHRYRWAITNPGTKVLSFNRMWTEKLNYQAADIGVSLNIIKLIRKFMAAHFKTIVDMDWNEYFYIFGDERKLNLEQAVQLYIDHVDFHRKLIDRNLEMYRNKVS